MRMRINVEDDSDNAIDIVSDNDGEDVGEEKYQQQPNLGQLIQSSHERMKYLQQQKQLDLDQSRRRPEFLQQLKLKELRQLLEYLQQQEQGEMLRLQLQLSSPQQHEYDTPAANVTVNANVSPVQIRENVNALINVFDDTPLPVESTIIHQQAYQHQVNIQITLLLQAAIEGDDDEEETSVPICAADNAADNAAHYMIDY